MMGLIWFKDIMPNSPIMEKQMEKGIGNELPIPV